MSINKMQYQSRLVAIIKRYTDETNIETLDVSERSNFYSEIDEFLENLINVAKLEGMTDFTIELLKKKRLGE